MINTKKIVLAAGFLMFALATAHAAPANVKIIAYDSKGSATNLCATARQGLNPSPLKLGNCESGNPDQVFTFDTNTQGGFILKDILTADGTMQLCVSLRAGQSTDWEIGSVLELRNCDDPSVLGNLWRWSDGTKIYAVNSPNRSFCIGANPTTGNKSGQNPSALVINDCNDKDGLPQWDILLTR